MVVVRMRTMVVWLAAGVVAPVALGCGGAPAPGPGAAEPGTTTPAAPMAPATCSAEPEAATPAGPVALEAGFEQGQDQKVVRAGEVEWGPCPPSLPGDCQMAVLEGNPKERQVFTVRIRTEGELRMPAHTHPANERVTILDGTVSVGFGDELNTDEGTTFEPGDYYVNRAGAAHYVWADAPVTLQITGIGPWKVQYLEAP